MEDGSVKRLQRYLSLLMCLALLATGTLAYAEGEPAPEVPATEAATEAPTQAPTEAPTEVPTEAPTEAPTQAPTEKATAAPTQAPTQTPAVQAEAEQSPAIAFQEPERTYKLSQIVKGFDYAKEFALKEDADADGAKLVWSTSDQKIAAFVEYDKDGNPPTETTPKEEITVAFEVYKAGTVTVRAALASDDKVYGEFSLILTEPEYLLSLDSSAFTLKIGETRTLAAAFTKDGAPVDGAEIAWTSDSEHATVSAGLVTAVSEGSAVISAKCTYEGKDYTATASVAVERPALTGIAVNDIQFYSDGTGTLTATPVPENAAFDPSLLKFAVVTGSEGFISVSGPTVSAVTVSGLLNTTGTSVTAKVLVTYGTFTKEATVTVYQAATAVAIPGAEASVWVQKTANLGVTVSPANSYDVIKSYASSDDAVFTVDASGTITGVKVGKANVTVEMKSGKTFVFPVAVRQGTVAMEISAPAGNKRIGETVQLTAVRTPLTAEDKIIWTTSDAAIATVDEKGLVTMILPGTVTITATSETGVTVPFPLTIIRPAKAIAFYNDIFANFPGYILGVNQAVTTYITVLPLDASSTRYQVTSSNPAVADILGSAIRGFAVGSATFTVTSQDGEVVRTFVVKVVKSSQAIRTIKLNKSSVSIKEGTSYALKASVNSGAASKTVQWGSENPLIATVSAKGVIKGVAPGTTYIWAMLYSGQLARVKVTIQAQYPTSVKLNKSSVSLYPDATYQLKATISPANVLQPANRVITWKTKDVKVAIVNDAGLVYGISPGTTYIYAVTVNGKSSRCKVTVKARSVTAVDVTNPYGDLLVGGTYTLPCAISPENATNRAVTWALASSSYQNFATINASTGAIYCKKVGTIKVTATAKDGSRKKETITLKIVSVPLVSFSVTRDAVEIGKGANIELAYGTSFTAVATVNPALYMEWTTSDARVASVSGGLITATGAGSATIAVLAGGLYSYSFTVTVPRDASMPTYRALVIGQYQTSSASGYLPFSKNSATGARDALKRSAIGGERYSVAYQSNLTSASAVTSAISSTFASAKEGRCVGHLPALPRHVIVRHLLLVPVRFGRLLRLDHRFATRLRHEGDQGQRDPGHLFLLQRRRRIGRFLRARNGQIHGQGIGRWHELFGHLFLGRLQPLQLRG